MNRKMLLLLSLPVIIIIAPVVIGYYSGSHTIKETYDNDVLCKKCHESTPYAIFSQLSSSAHNTSSTQGKTSCICHGYNIFNSTSAYYINLKHNLTIKHCTFCHSMNCTRPDNVSIKFSPHYITNNSTYIGDVIIQWREEKL